MAYGLSATNSDGETVVDDIYPTMVSGSTGTLTQTGSSSGYRLYNNALLGFTGQDLPVMKLPVGGRINFFPVNNIISNDVPQVISTEPSQPFHNMVPRDTLAAPTGYGAAVYNASGDCVWDAESSVCKVVSGGSVPVSFFNSNNQLTTNTVSINSTANAVFYRGGEFYLRQFDFLALTWSFFMERTSTTLWTFKGLPTNIASTSNGAVYRSEMNYILADVT